MKKNRHCWIISLCITSANTRFTWQYFYHLIQTEYPLAGASDHDVSEALYLQDPEGNGIEIYHDYPSNTWRYEENGNIMMGTKRWIFKV